MNGGCGKLHEREDWSENPRQKDQPRHMVETGPHDVDGMQRGLKLDVQSCDDSLDIGGARQPDYSNEEWYKKWRRRQEDQPSKQVQSEGQDGQDMAWSSTARSSDVANEQFAHTDPWAGGRDPWSGGSRSRSHSAPHGKVPSSAARGQQLDCWRGFKQTTAACESAPVGETGADKQCDSAIVTPLGETASALALAQDAAPAVSQSSPSTSDFESGGGWANCWRTADELDKSRGGGAWGSTPGAAARWVTAPWALSPSSTSSASWGYSKSPPGWASPAGSVWGSPPAVSAWGSSPVPWGGGCWRPEAGRSSWWGKPLEEDRCAAAQVWRVNGEDLSTGCDAKPRFTAESQNELPTPLPQTPLEEHSSVELNALSEESKSEKITMNSEQAKPQDAGDARADLTAAPCPDWEKRQVDPAASASDNPTQVTELGKSLPVKPETVAEVPAQNAGDHSKPLEMDGTSPSGPLKKDYENEEWYQKWLRRQENKPRKIVDIGQAQASEQKGEIQEGEKETEHQETKVEVVERRINPDDGKAYTLAELTAHCNGAFSDAELKSYFMKDCKAVGADYRAPEPLVQEKQEHPHQNEEWYQKWLRRQQNKPRQIIEIGGPEKSVEKEGQDLPDSKTVPTDSEKLKETEPANSSEHPHQNEEWYQKWLRRQQNKPRQIIYLGGEQAQDGESKSQPEEAKPEEAKPEEAKPEEAKSSADNACKEESAPDEQGSSGDPSKKPYENEEWYQKWLRRQKNKPRQIIEIGGADRVHESTPEAANNTSDGLDKIEEPATPASTKSHENEEWYQKWLRRQQNKGRQIIEIGQPRQEESAPQEQIILEPGVAEQKRINPEDGKAYTLAELISHCKGAYTDVEMKAYFLKDCKPSGESVSSSSAGKPAEVAEAEAETQKQEPEKQEHPHQNEEWYQKWLRRQQNKPRQIIEIGCSKPIAETNNQNESTSSHEKKVDPSDGKTYTRSELMSQYKGTFSAEEIDNYFANECKALAVEMPNSLPSSGESPAAITPSLECVSALAAAQPSSHHDASNESESTQHPAETVVPQATSDGLAANLPDIKQRVEDVAASISAPEVVDVVKSQEASENERRAPQLNGTTGDVATWSGDSWDSGAAGASWQSSGTAMWNGIDNSSSSPSWSSWTAPTSSWNET